MWQITGRCGGGIYTDGETMIDYLNIHPPLIPINPGIPWYPWVPVSPFSPFGPGGPVEETKGIIRAGSPHPAARALCFPSLCVYFHNVMRLVPAWKKHNEMIFVQQGLIFKQFNLRFTHFYLHDYKFCQFTPQTAHAYTQTHTHTDTDTNTHTYTLPHAHTRTRSVCKRPCPDVC